MTTPQPTDVRWSPSENVLYVHPVDAPDRWVCQPAAPRRAASWAVPSLPADAVRLVPEEATGAGTATPADARQRAVETAGRWLHLDPKAWQRNPAIAGTVDALIAHPDVLAALAARTPGKPRPHLQRRVWKGEDGKDQHGPWHPCPTCPQEVVRQSASELDRTTFGDDAHDAFCDGTCKDWEAGDQLPGTGGRMCPQQPGRSLLAGGEQQ